MAVLGGDSLGIKRVVDTEFWEDDKVENMTPEEKYFWLYLLTNPYTKQLGIYKVTKKQMAFHLGYDIETVTKLLERFEDAYGLIKYMDGEVAIKNFLRHSILKGGKPVEDCLNADLKNVKHRSLIRWVFDGIDPSKVNATVMSVVGSWKESSKERINDNDIHNDNDNDSIVDYESSTIRSRFVETLKDFEEMRKKIKKPLTDKARALLLEKLQSLAPNDEEMQIKIMEQSIMNCWQSVYELKTGKEEDLRNRTREAYIKDVEMRERKAEKEKEGVWFE